MKQVSIPMIITSLRSISSQPCYFSSLPAKNLTRKASSSIRFASSNSSAASSDEPNKNMDKVKNSHEDKPDSNKTEDAMSHSFGEGYATRCDDEGFGGTCGGNEPNPKNSKDHTEYDKTQGSEVKEKERARFQTDDN